MGIRKCVMALTALALPIASVALLEGTAVAKTALGTGAVSCHLSGGVTFSPPLTPAGVSASKEVVTVNIAATGCSGGAPPQSSATITTKALKIKATKTGKTKIAGSCNDFATAAKTISVKSKWAWASPAKKTKTLISNLSEGVNGEGEVGFSSSSVSVSGSYGSSGSVAVYFTPTSSDAILGCVAGSSSAQVSSLTLDTSSSSATLG